MQSARHTLSWQENKNNKNKNFENIATREKNLVRIIFGKNIRKSFFNFLWREQTTQKTQFESFSKLKINSNIDSLIRKWEKYFKYQYFKWNVCIIFCVRYHQIYLSSLKFFFAMIIGTSKSLKKVKSNFVNHKEKIFQKAWFCAFEKLSQQQRSTLKLS